MSTDEDCRRTGQQWLWVAVRSAQDAVEGSEGLGRVGQTLWGGITEPGTLAEALVPKPGPRQRPQDNCKQQMSEKVHHVCGGVCEGQQFTRSLLVTM